MLSEVRYSAEIRLLQKENIDSHSDVRRETVSCDIPTLISTISILPNTAVQILSVVGHSAEIRLLPKRKNR